MTIFDSIKYPISEPPTEEELTSLPPEIFNKWKKQSGFASSHHSPRYVSEWYRYGISKIDVYQFKLLRQMIRDYDNL